MNTRKRNWLPGFVAILLLIGVPVWLFTGETESKPDTPWEFMPKRPAHVDHKNLFDGYGELTTGPQVTRAGLSCHADAGEQILHTSHWKRESEPDEGEGREGLHTTGKKNSINKF